jgi:hypothetical protein
MATLKANGGVIKKWSKQVTTQGNDDIVWRKRVFALCANGVVLSNYTVCFKPEGFSKGGPHSYGWKKELNATTKLTERKNRLEKTFKSKGYVAA